MSSDRQYRKRGTDQTDRQSRSRFGRLKNWLRRVWHRIRPAPATKPAETVAPPAIDRRLVVRSTSRARSENGRLRVLPWMAPSRDYILLQPTRPAANLKLLVLIHGCKQEAELFARASGAYDLVRTGEWAVLLPDQSRTANMYRCWNWFDSACVDGQGEAAIVLEAIANVQADPELQNASCVIAGLSSGAALAAAIVTNHPEKFGAAVFFAGLPMGAALSAWSAKDAMAKGPERDITLKLPTTGTTAALIVHGDKDEIVAGIHADELTRQMLALNEHIEPGAPLPEPDEISTTEASTDETSSRHGFERARFANCERLIVHGMGHAWSGGNSEWPYFDSQGPDGMSLITGFVEWQMKEKSSETDVTELANDVASAET